MSEAKRKWIEKRLALYEKWKSLKFKQEASDRERIVRQAAINKEWEELSNETKQLMSEEPKEE